MGGAINLDSLSPQEIADELNRRDAEEMNKSKAESQPLQGEVSNFTPKMRETDARVARDVFPQPGENPVSTAAKSLAFPVQAAANGLESVPEDLVNFVAGLAQQGRPQGQRQTFGDMVRRIDPGFVSPGEFQQAPQFQQQLQQHPAANMMWNPAQVAGGFLAPIGGVEAKALAPAIKFIEGAIPGVQMGGRAVQQIARNVPQMQRVLNYAPRMSPTVAGGLTGAAYAPAFAGGQQFGQTRTLPTPQQMQGQALAGGALGAGTAHIIDRIQRFLFLQKLKQLAGGSQLDALPQAPAAAQQREAIPSAPALSSNLQAIGYKNLARERTAGGAPRSEAHKAAVQKRIFDYAERKAAPESDEHVEAVAKARSSFAKEQYARGRSEGQTQERRQYSQQQRDERTGQSIAKRDTEFERTGRHTDQNANAFIQLTDHIDHAETHEELRDIENTVFAPGRGPKGQRLLDSAQQRKLERRIHERHRELTEAEESAGESEGPPPGSPAGPRSEEPRAPQNNPNSRPPAEPSSPAPGPSPATPPAEPKTASPAVPTSAPPAVPEKPSPNAPTPKTAEKEPDAAYQPIRDFIQGAWRKSIDVKTYGNRENRYKFAVSADALGHAAGLSREKITALENWTRDAAETRRELTYKQKELEQLVEWAYKNEEQWSGSGDKVKFQSVQGKDGSYNQVLTHTEREGRFKTLALRSKMERYFEKKTETNLERVKMNMMRYGFERAGEAPETVLKTNPKPSVLTTLNGVVEKDGWQENKDGALKLFGDIQPIQSREFTPPKNADELFARAESLKKRISHFENDLQDVYGAHGKHNYLGDGTTPAEVMGEAFDNLKMDMKKPGDTPAVHLWHVDKANHVSTIRFDQAKSRMSWPEHMKDLESRYRLLEKKTLALRGKNGKLDHDAVWKNASSLLHGFTGWEVVPILGMMLGKKMHEVAAGISRNYKLRALAVGTIDDLLRGNARFGGDEVSAQLHGMLGEISAAFFNDKAGILHPVQGAEELSEMLNDFKGVKLSRTNYRKAARDAAQKAGKTTEVEASEAERRADTAFMIRRKYDQLSKAMQPYIDEMEIRKRDAQTGEESREGKRFYTGEDKHADGRIRESAYNAAYHETLNELQKALRLQSDNAGLGGFIGDIASRKSMSIMANNPRVALKNLFDQAPITLAYFHKHFLNAAIDLSHNAEIKEAVGRLPVVPASDTNLVRLEEAMKNRDGRPAEDIYQGAKQNLQKLDHFLQTKLDFIFNPKGSAPLVSAADRMYTRVSSLASMYKIAERYGIPREQFVRDLIDGKFSAAQQKAIFAEVSEDLSRVYNSVAPHLNKDMFASSDFGKLNQQYSTPGRRAFRLMWDWMRSDNPADKMKFLAAFSGLAALGGSGALPQTTQMALKFAASATGANEAVQQTLDNFDELNVLRKLSGIDYSTNFGPDIMTGAAPALQAIQKMYGKAKGDVGKQNYGGAAADVLLEGLSLLPKIGPLGFDVWMSGLKDLEGAQQNSMKYYFNTGDEQLHSVTVQGFTYLDALQKFMFGGSSARAFPMIQKAKMDAAKKADAKFRSGQAIIRPSSSASTPRDAFPTLKQSGT